ncbi:MAG: hypothetical protein IK114_00505 [Fibrobacter sp.]|nr:hypothetical protein [Fibrobacter sp.]
MKPSPYFKDCFKYFFKRFKSKESLFKWFLNQAGEDSGVFDFPASLKGYPKTLVFLDRNLEKAAVFMRAMPDVFFKNAFVCAHESQQVLVSARRAKAVYYSDLECRYGESVFEEIECKCKEFAPKVCIYLGQAFLPTLYLAKVSGAGCRIGFSDENCFPFLNVCLHPTQSSEAALISQYYGVK